ncbi:GFA family protein [Paraburkholderia pallida]|uniref:Aldehyde-activating protein n=1 Tax=Paraburkholderia pallida TaxID=2547399 RepID=A0A4P7D501_9BURK|nr:GFA family protein [Paraburkholderia pallida]QBR01845.1 aldehyde-activating protein [Paraburkholderia pallida]
MNESRKLACLCGAVTVDLIGEPAALANCHCQTCRDFYGTSMLSATAWAPDSVATNGALQVFQHPHKQMSRAFCPACGETMFGTNRLNMRVVPNSLLARAHGGTLPADRQPTMHLFYRHRVIDVSDALPKYLDGWDGPVYEEGD